MTKQQNEVLKEINQAGSAGTQVNGFDGRTIRALSLRKWVKTTNKGSVVTITAAGKKELS